MMMVQYLIDADARRRDPGRQPRPRCDFADIVEPVALALAQEKRVTEQINALAGCARGEGDYTSEQFVQWFIKEQVEEVATMSRPPARRRALQATTRWTSRTSWRASTPAGEGADPTAPAAAGATD